MSQSVLLPDPLPSHLVLYVEDDAVNVVLMQAVFQRHRPDCQLLVASDCASAMEVARGRKPDLLLLDIWLPDCMGSDLLERLRQLPGWTVAPAVAVTSDAGFDIVGSSFCERWLKPIRVDGVLAGLDRLLPMDVGAMQRITRAA